MKVKCGTLFNVPEFYILNSLFIAMKSQKLYVAENESSSLSSQLTSTKTHLESSHKEIRQLRGLFKITFSFFVIVTFAFFVKRARSLKSAATRIRTWVTTATTWGPNH